MDDFSHSQLATILFPSSRRGGVANATRHDPLTCIHCIYSAIRSGNPATHRVLDRNTEHVHVAMNDLRHSGQRARQLTALVRSL